MMPRLSLAAVLALLAVPTLSAQPTTDVLRDSDFRSWSLAAPATGGSAVAVRMSEGGQSHYRVTQTLNPGSFGSAALLSASAWTWRPAANGAVDNFGFRASLRIGLPPPPPGTVPPATVRVALLVIQGGRTFRSLQSLVWQQFFAAESTWLAYPQLSVPAEGFRDIAGSAARPDFTPAGGAITFGLEVSVQVPTPTGSAYRVELDDLVVTAFRAANGAPGLAFEDKNASIQLGDTVFSVQSQNFLSQVNPSIGRIGNPGARLVGSGTWQLQGGGADERIRTWGRAVEPGETFQVISLPDAISTICPYQLTMTLDRVQGGQAYSPTRLEVLVVPQILDGSCFAAFFGVLTQRLLCPRSSPAANRFTAGEPGARKSTDGPADLATLRAFRDQVMAPSPVGRYYRELYTTHSPAAIGAFFKRPQLVFDLDRAWDAWVAGAAAMVAGRGASVTVTPQMLADLRAVLDTLKSAGTPSLTRAIEKEEARLGIGSWAGMTFQSLWQRVLTVGGSEPCATSATALCLNQGRYRVEADWKRPNGATGRGQAVRLTGDSGYFWFFDAGNVEVLTKVIDACPLNQRTWAFAAGLTDVEVELFVEDTRTGVGQRYVNPQGQAFQPIQDTNAFATCSD